MSLIEGKMKSLIDKYKMQGIILALCVLLGCVSGISGKELFPIHARPPLPNVLIEPDRIFSRCGDSYYCIDENELESLRVWVISVQSLLNKYEHATEVLND